MQHGCDENNPHDQKLMIDAAALRTLGLRPICSKANGKLLLQEDLAQAEAARALLMDEDPAPISIILVQPMTIATLRTHAVVLSKSGQPKKLRKSLVST
jgi:hypothetical protein